VIVIDVEASALFRGYPIEIGWASLDGRIGAHLIKPTVEWVAELFWHPFSNKVHKLHSQTCWNLGESPFDVMSALNKELDGLDVWSDGPKFDQKWLNLLHDASGIGRIDFRFQKDDVELVLQAKTAECGLAPEVADYIAEKRAASHTHTAAGDAAGWIAALHATKDQASDVDFRRIDAIFADWRRKSELVSRRWRPIF